MSEQETLLVGVALTIALVIVALIVRELTICRRRGE